MQNWIFNEITEEVRHFMDSIGDGVLVVSKDGVILTCNKAICNILGREHKKDLIGQPILPLLCPTDATGAPITKKNAALFKSINNGEKVLNALRQFVKKDGNRIWASITTTPIVDKKNKVEGAVLIIRDITEEKQEEEYRADFAHIASHNLRSPLGNVMWAVEYLISQKPGPLNAQQEEYLNDSYKTLKEMNRLVNDLLSISNIPYKKIQPALKKISLEEMYAKVYNDLQYYARSHNVEIELNNENKKHFVKADEHHIRTILQNIIENAVRYSFPKNPIKVEFKKEGKYIIFSCTNAGIGIPENKKKFIFAKFFRAPNAVNHEGQGTGLGLYIVSELVGLNKGKIWFESEENKSTTFYIKLLAY